MKKILYSVLLIVTVAFVACNSDNDPNDGRFGSANPKSGFVVFDTTATSFNGVSGCAGDSLIISEVSFPVALRSSFDPRVQLGPTNEDGIEVSYDITQVEGSMDGITVSPIVIPAGSNSTEFTVTYPSNLTSSVEFKITLTSANDDNVTVTAPGIDEPQTLTVRINVGIDSFYGMYDGTRTGVAQYQSDVTPGILPNEVIISNIFGNDPNATTRAFLNEDGTITFPPFLENFLRVGTGTQGNIYIDGSNGGGGTYDLCAGTFTVRYRLRFGPTQNQTSALTTVVFTKS